MLLEESLNKICHLDGDGQVDARDTVADIVADTDQNRDGNNKSGGMEGKR